MGGEVNFRSRLLNMGLLAYLILISHKQPPFLIRHLPEISLFYSLKLIMFESIKMPLTTVL